MRRRLTPADVEVRLRRELRKGRTVVERVEAGVTERQVHDVHVSGVAYGLAIWLEAHTGEPADSAIARLAPVEG